MHKFKRLLLVKIIILTSAIFYMFNINALTLINSNTSMTPTEAKSILILSSYHRGLLWNDKLEEGILSELNLIKNYDLDIKIDYMDIKENDDIIYHEKLVDLYMYKYKDKKFDLILCNDNSAFEFLIQFRKKLFPNIPIVFSGINYFDHYNTKDMYNMTGITEDVDIEGNLNLILSLHPNIKNITAVIDNSPLGESFYNELKSIENTNKYNVKLHIIRNESLPEVIKNINELPSSNALLFMTCYLKNTTGAKTYSLEALKHIKPHINIPIYGLWDVDLNSGIVGGKVTSGFQLGKLAGQASVRILEGESPNNIAIKRNEGINYIFDYNELKNFSLDSNNLPKSSIIINTPPTVYSIAKKEFKNIAFVVVVLFLIIIVILAINISKRIKLSKELNENKNNSERKLDFLRTLLDTIPNPIFCKNMKGEYNECNMHFEKMLGLKREDILNKKVCEVYEGESTKIFNLADRMLIKNGGTQIYETKLKVEDGTNKDVLFNKALIHNSDNDITGIVGVIVDITERKKREYKLSRLAKLRDSIIELNQSIIGMNNIKELFDLILETAIESIDGAEYGSILLLGKNNNLTLTSCRGYDENKSKGFSIPLTHSFYWLETKGNIKSTVIINNVHAFDKIKDIYAKDLKETWHINSCISAPIIIDNSLYGLLNIDSNKLNAFSEEDLEIMEYLRAQIEISITKHNLYEKMIYFSKYDNLTNIYNRKAFKDIFHNDFYNVKNFSLVVFDLNRLKFVNDTYGHLIGDYYIKTFVKGLEKIIDENDIIARYGGDEFIGLFYDSEDILIAKFEALLEYFKINPLKLEENDVICSFSYGISKCPNDSTDYDELIKIADERMYLYKRNTR